MSLLGDKMKQLLSVLDKKVNKDRGEVVKSIQESVDYLNEFVHSNNDVFVDFLSNVRNVYDWSKRLDKVISIDFNDSLIKLRRWSFGGCYITVLDGHNKCYFELSIGGDNRLKTEFKALQLDNYYDFKKETNHYKIDLSEKVELSELTFKDLNIIDRDMKTFIDDMKIYMNISIEDRMVSAIENVYKVIGL